MPARLSLAFPRGKIRQREWTAECYRFYSAVYVTLQVLMCFFQDSPPVMTATATGLFKAAIPQTANRALLWHLACRCTSFQCIALYFIIKLSCHLSYQIRLTHVSTKRNLHSHLVTSPLTHQQEVSCYGKLSGSQLIYCSFVIFLIMLVRRARRRRCW